MYAAANSCVDRLNTEGNRDPATRLTQTANKRRERAAPAETDEKKQIAANQYPSTQTERLAAESATEIDIKLQQMSALQCETKRLTAETITERDTRFYSE